MKEYRDAITAVLAERGEFCEVCGVPARHCHHINPVSETGIASRLVTEPANMMVLCNDCHALMHPGSRNRNMWWNMGRAATARGVYLQRRRA